LDRQVRERVRQLVRSERLAGIGFLAAGVAHEINNPLSAITIAADSMEDRLDEALSQADQDQADLFRQYFQMIQREASRCQQITNKLLDFARGEEAQRSRYDVTALVSEVLAMVQHMSKFRDRNIEFDDSRPCYAEVNGPEIKQVVLNLVSNALESMELDGTLQIEIIEQTDYVVLRMQDDGCGMTEEVIEHLFEPFFTNRRDGTGTGLGLSISHRIIADHGGSIDAHSDGPGQGTIFHVCLPREASNPNVAA
jgi:signal transduction histidine kinase